MANREWYRNQTWDDRIAADFERRLKRSREANRSQYLRIQACELAQKEPEVAIALLERYFEKPDIFAAQGYVDRADAFFALGRIEDALKSLEKAFTQERKFPGVQTNAYLDYGIAVALHAREERYDRAFRVLKSQRSRLTLPIDFFLCHAAIALIWNAKGDYETSRREALAALDAASIKSSGMRYHKSLGVVGKPQEKLVHLIAELAGRENPFADERE